MVALVLADHLVRQGLVRRADPVRGIRKEIDLLDDAIFALIVERQGLVGAVGKAKKRAGAPVDDPRREKRIIARLVAMAGGTPLGERLVRGIYSEIFRHSRSIQKR
jgi:chorismate mutase